MGFHGCFGEVDNVIVLSIQKVHRTLLFVIPGRDVSLLDSVPQGERAVIPATFPDLFLIPLVPSQLFGVVKIGTIEHSSDPYG